MSTTLATTAPAATFVNPLAIDEPADRVDQAVTAMIDSAVATVEDEVKRMIRRREVAAAVRGIRRAKADLDEVNQADADLGLAALTIDGHRAELLRMFATLNPAADTAAVAQTVDAVLAGYKAKFERPEAKAKRGKS
jgi:hypothetical protein